MANQTIAQIPVNLADPDSMKRFLQELVGNLDVVLGYKGSTSYTTTADLQKATGTVTEIADEVTTVKESLTTNSDSLQTAQEDIEDLQDDMDAVYKAAALTDDYKDFNATVWNDVKGAFEFSGLGSELINPPATLVPGNTYNVYGVSYDTTNSVLQLFWLDSGSVNVYTRVGVNSSWITLS